MEHLQTIREIQPNNPKIYYNIACLYSKQNIQDESLSWLKRAVEKGFRDYSIIRNDPDLASIRKTEYVKRLMDSAGPISKQENDGMHYGTAIKK
jgi:hypothetical protein